MKFSRVVGFALLTASFSVVAQIYPDKTKILKIIVPSGGGSSTDLLARAYSRAISESGGIDAIVENKAGADGIVGMHAAKNAAAALTVLNRLEPSYK